MKNHLRENPSRPKLALRAGGCVAALLLSVSAAHGQRGWEWEEEAKLTASDASAGDEFGVSVSMSGKTALIGSHWDDDVGHMSGSVYMFVRFWSGWGQQAKLVGSEVVGGSRFGRSVCLSGDTAVIGALWAGGLGTVPATYVFVRSGTAWSQQAVLTPSLPVYGDGFGWSVSLSGDTVLVGAPGKKGGLGAAYVFVQSGSTWTQQAKLQALDGAANDEFGDAVAIDGDTALVGAGWDDDLGGASGSAYVLVRSGSTWSQQAKLLAPSATTADIFGCSVAIDHDTALVGARGSDAVEWNSGAAHVFVRSGTVWSHQAMLTGAVAKDAYFGSSVSIEGDTALIGARGEDGWSGSTGAAYIFVRTGTTWSRESRFEASDAGFGDELGGSVSLSGDTALIGACAEDEYGIDAGAAYVYLLQPWASVTFRNAGTNPVSYHTDTAPVLGSTYNGMVELGITTGHSHALLVGYTTPLTLTLGGGQTLLVDIADPDDEMLGQLARIPHQAPICEAPFVA